MFNKRLKMLRESYNLNQTQLANKLKVTKQTISNWENDNILPSIDMLIRIADFFKVSSDYLLGLDDKNYIEVSNLSIETISHIQQIINDIKNSGKKLEI